MPISDKLAVEIYTIVLFHIVSLLLLFGFSFYIYLRAKKTPLLYSYLSVVIMILLWMVSKILKTVAPAEGLRWFFIVTQYFGISFLGFCLVIFAYIYTKDRIPSRKAFLVLAILPLLSFWVVLTNPMHMSFYSHFDFYKDRFGVLFFPIQIIQYLYLLAGIVMLSRGFTHQVSFKGKQAWAQFFSLMVLLPLVTNIYYILYKMSDIPWIFPFPVFDFTPIAGALALILFMLPALKYRFFDSAPLSYGRLFAQMPQGFVFLDAKKTLYAQNSAFFKMFPQAYETMPFDSFAHTLSLETPGSAQALLEFVESPNDKPYYELRLIEDITYKVNKNALKRNSTLLCFTDISTRAAAERLLIKQNAELSHINQRLDTLAQNTKALAIAKTKATLAQNMHDILGHSLTVAIGTLDLATTDTDKTSIDLRLTQIIEHLTNSLNDLKNTFIGRAPNWGQTSLTKAVSRLKNQKITLEFVTQGCAYELSSPQTEAVFGLCREAITNAIQHGHAKTIHIIFRYKPQEVEVFAIDNGRGCSQITKNLGLSGMEARFQALGGGVQFTSDGEQGFTIRALLPIPDAL